MTPSTVTTWANRVALERRMGRRAAQGPHCLLTHSLPPALLLLRGDGHSSRVNDGRLGWVELLLCCALALGWAAEVLIPSADAGWTFGPEWLPLAAAGVAAAAILWPNRSPGSLRAKSTVRWAAILLLVWVANGLPFDLLTMAGLIGHRTASGEVVMATVYWPGFATRTFAVVAAVVLARPALARPIATTARPPRWYGYVAFLLALPYPALRVHWALGGTLGLSWAGAAGSGWEPVVIAIPWMVAAVVSLLLVSPPAWLPRRLLLGAGWSGTVIVAMIGPAAVWSLISAWANGVEPASGGIASWVFALFYVSWFLWAIAAAAATRSYQVRTVGIAASTAR